MAVIVCAWCQTPLIPHCHSTRHKGQAHPTCTWLRCGDNRCGAVIDAAGHRAFDRKGELTWPAVDE